MGRLLAAIRRRYAALNKALEGLYGTYEDPRLDG